MLLVKPAIRSVKFAAKSTAGSLNQVLSWFMVIGHVRSEMSDISM
jgi:hypothetical protein